MALSTRRIACPHAARALVRGQDSLECRDDAVWGGTSRDTRQKNGVFRGFSVGGVASCKLGAVSKVHALLDITSTRATGVDHF